MRLEAKKYLHDILQAFVGIDVEEQWSPEVVDLDLDYDQDDDACILRQ